ncbi:hypothetical protein J7E26_10010 [Bacillus sp. ISL-51]|uniref:PRC-barrel domain-containing protein n=1 Tax=unclassified Bacillus (in: firmicutes) TaxID=185979 RepID=UPI001BE5D67B|nr:MULTISPECIES: hypothetical protein [unclassified Bacillus (in: firmicutes)]MBT2574287.1 hypothetical protein [Bacillus sp. ISL-51]MBT2633104.1 hypothetical protein [Bacillus sp. ISL-26]
MRTCHAAEGRTVYAERTSRNLGMISDVCFSLDGQFLGFVLEQKRLFHYRHLFLQASDISDMNQQAVFAVTDHLQPLPKSCFTFEQIKMQPVKSPEGEMMGLMEDVYFCMDKGIIVAYELSDGFFSDLAGKRQVRRAADTLIEIGKDGIVLNG